MPWMPSASDEFAWRDGEAFGLAHARGEGDVEHEGLHVVVLLAVVERVAVAGFGVADGLDGGCELSGLEDRRVR